MSYNELLKSVIYAHTQTKYNVARVYLRLCAHRQQILQSFCTDSNHLFWDMTQNVLLTESKERLVELDRNNMSHAMCTFMIGEVETGEIKR
jgi:hypothetical protein